LHGCLLLLLLLLLIPLLLLLLLLLRHRHAGVLVRPVLVPAAVLVAIRGTKGREVSSAERRALVLVAPTVERLLLLLLLLLLVGDLLLVRAGAARVVVVSVRLVSGVWDLVVMVLAGDLVVVMVLLWLCVPVGGWLHGCALSLSRDEESRSSWQFERVSLHQRVRLLLSSSSPSALFLLPHTSTSFSLPRRHSNRHDPHHRTPCRSLPASSSPSSSPSPPSPSQPSTPARARPCLPSQLPSRSQSGGQETEDTRTTDGSSRSTLSSVVLVPFASVE
jgi:hypothetical protein